MFSRTIGRNLLYKKPRAVYHNLLETRHIRRGQRKPQVHRVFSRFFRTTLPELLAVHVLEIEWQKAGRRMDWFRRLYWQGKVGFGLVMGGIVLMVLTVVNVSRPGWERDQPPGWEHAGEFAVGLIVLGGLLINAWRRTR